MSFFAFFCRLIEILLAALSVCMFLRVVLPFVIDAEHSRFYLFLTVVTEFFVFPVRFILERYEVVQQSPIDMSFFTAYFLLILLRAFLPAV